MMHSRLFIAVMGLMLLALQPALFAGSSGELAVSVGGTYMQKDLYSFDGPGGMFELRGAIALKSAPYISFWGDLSVAGFGIGSLSYKGFSYPPYFIPSVRSSNQSVYSGHLGLQIATSSRTSTVRPHAMLGIGFYHFHEEEAYDLGWEEYLDFSDNYIDNQSCLGFKFRLGADIFVYKRFGLTTGFVYDRIYGYTVKQSDNGSEKDLDVHLAGFTIGAIWQFGM